MSFRKNITPEILDEAGFRPLFAGDDYTYKFTLVDSSAVAIDITGATIWFTIKADPVEKDSAAKLQLKTPTEIVITDGANGKFSVVFLPADTLSLEGENVYDLKILIGTKLYRIAYGTIEFLPNITRETS